MPTSTTAERFQLGCAHHRLVKVTCIVDGISLRVPHLWCESIHIACAFREWLGHGCILPSQPSRLAMINVTCSTPDPITSGKRKRAGIALRCCQPNRPSGIPRGAIRLTLFATPEAGTATWVVAIEHCGPTMLEVFR